MNRNYYLLQIKEGPCGGPFYDCVDKWISNNRAVVFSRDSLKQLNSKTDSNDIKSFIDEFSSAKNDNAIIISIGSDVNGINTIYIYEKEGPLKDFGSKGVDPAHYKICAPENAIGFNIHLLAKDEVIHCPLVLATIKSNTRLTMGTFKRIADPNAPESHLNSYFGNIMAIEYILNNRKKVKVDNFSEYLECLSPIEFETLIAKLKEEEGFFVPAYKGGMLKDYDLICRKKGSQENIQVKLNLSKQTYNKYKKKNLSIYCVSKSDEIKNPEIKIFDHNDLIRIIKNCPKTKAWLKESLNWVDFNF